MENFYTYIYLDPRKPGIYKYKEYKFNFEPFYVGKGSNNRCFIHLKCNDKSNLYKTNKIKAILSKSLQPILIECQSIKLEIDLIKIIGRINLGTGPLTNLTDGGEGHSGMIVSEETKRKIGKINSNPTKETITKLINAKKKYFENGGITWMKGKTHSEKTKQLMSKNHVNVNGNKNPMYGKTHSEEIRKKLSKLASKKIGSKNPNSKSIIINNIKYETIIEACKILNLSYYKLNKLKLRNNYV
jgi:hypothetical protein